MSKLIFTTKPRIVVDKWEIGAITDRMTYEFGHFIEIRGNRQTDIRHFAKCPACQAKHKPTDKVYSAFGVIKNGKHIGNLFACASCFVRYGEATK